MGGRVGTAGPGLKAPGDCRWTRWVQEMLRLRAENLERGGVWMVRGVCGRSRRLSLRHSGSRPTPLPTSSGVTL